MSRPASLPGFRDFYPPDLAIRAHIMAAWREAARRHGFEEYDGPPLEALELYTEKSGEEIAGQLYAFTDKGGRSVALRPEMTPTLARMVGSRAGALRKPIRWFTMPQLFRYERTQRGRLREHFQWNVDVIGEPDVAADAEVLAVGLDALRLLGLGEADVVARVNDRSLMEKLLGAIGVEAAQLSGAYAAIDKLGREPRDRIRERLESAGISAATAGAVLGIFDVPDLGGLLRRFPEAGIEAEVLRLETHGQQLAELGHPGVVRFDPGIVRGLAYYTGIVFEIFDRAGALRAICGGGRYDRLLAALGGTDLPAVGFGMGDVVLRELLTERGLLPDLSPAIDFFLITVTDAERPALRQAAARLRAAGRTVSYAFRAGSVGRQFKEADARGARHTVVLGPDDLARGEAVVREMASGTERRVPLDRLGEE
jgi:histidyl-tRNA synthetase